ncbi:unnamed protein product [Notodromas monacha]|uniref:Chitin-binding type-2 domain-containing protein n=1 Tax=Notodromas monacha TaxID=399045 RepID=A0A7R9BDT7_9CRUS|nr:unnamed protein product [Notodromas monacha]CAG0913557.1 unnamed protein product [Notodromas monacha]
MKTVRDSFRIPTALCKEHPNGNVALGKSCNRYWHCQGGYPRLQRCPAMLVFDKNSLRCVVPPTEDCEVPPPSTTEASQGEDNGDGDNEGNNNGVQQQQPKQRPVQSQQQNKQQRPQQIPAGASSTRQ